MVFQKGHKAGGGKKASAGKKDEVKDADILAEVNQAMAKGEEIKPIAEVPVSTSYYSVWNMTVNPILLRWEKSEIEIISRECKKIDAEIFDELKKLKYIKDLLDKGLLRATKYVDEGEPLSKEISVQKAPENLTQNVSRSDGVLTMTAEVKKVGGKAFKPVGTVDLNF